MNDTQYKGYYITQTNDHDASQFVVQYKGQDMTFDDEKQAKTFIDGVTDEDGITEAKKEDDKDDNEQPSHFDIEPDEVEPEEDEYDEDDVLLEEGDDDIEEDVDIAPVENPDVPNVAPYSTKDLALGVIDLLNSDTQDYNTGVYNKQEDAFDRLAEMKIFAQMPEEDWTAVVEDFDTAILQKFIEAHPKQADFIFNTVAKVFGFNNYEDYKSYLDNIGEGESGEILLMLPEPDEDIEEIRYEIPTDSSPYDYEDDEDDEPDLIDINDAFGVTESKETKNEDIYDRDDKFVFMNNYDTEDWLDLINEYIGMDASNAFKEYINDMESKDQIYDYASAMKDAIKDLKGIDASIKSALEKVDDPDSELYESLLDISDSIFGVREDLKDMLKDWGEEGLKESRKLRREVTNAGAIVNAPAKHKRIDLDEEDVEVLNEEEPEDEEF